MKSELRQLYPSLSSAEAQRLSEILYNEGVWKKNLPLLINPTEDNLEDGSKIWNIANAVKLLTNSYYKKERILVIGDDTTDSVIAVNVLIKNLRYYGFDIDYKITRKGINENKVIVDSTNADYINENYALVIAIGDIMNITYKTNSKKRPRVHIVIDDSPLLSLSVKNIKQTEILNARYKIIGDEVVLYPNCKVYLNAQDPDSHYRNKELSKVGMAYKLIEQLFIKQNWDMNQLKTCEVFPCIGLIASEKKMYCAEKQSYENRYFYELAKKKLGYPNETWLFTLNEIKRKPKWDCEVIRSLLVNTLQQYNDEFNEIDIVEFLNKKVVGEAHSIAYQLFSIYEKRKVTLNKCANILKNRYKEHNKYTGWIFAKCGYETEYQFTTLIDANNKNASLLNKVCCVNLATDDSDKDIILISTPRIIKNRKFLGYLQTNFGQLDRRGRSIVLIIDRKKRNSLLNTIDVLIQREKEELFINYHLIEFEQITDNILKFVSRNGIEVNGVASKNQVAKVIKNEGSTTLVAKRHTKTCMLITWDKLDIAATQNATDVYNIYYKFANVNNRKKHRLIRVEKIINETR